MDEYYSMSKAAQIPAYPEDRKEFKIIASKLGISMKDLFHTWITQHQDGDAE